MHIITNSHMIVNRTYTVDGYYTLTIFQITIIVTYINSELRIYCVESTK